MSNPARVQLRRAKGWRMPDHCRSVARPNRWGNLYRPDDMHLQASGPALGYYAGRYDPALTCQYDMPVEVDPIVRAAVAVQLYRGDLLAIVDRVAAGPANLPKYDPLDDVEVEIAEALGDLRGWDLGCWCRPDWPCHADVLLELANR